MLINTLLFATVATTGYMSGPTATHVMRTDEAGVVCTAATDEEVEDVQLRRQVRRQSRLPDVQHLINTYRDSSFTLIFDSDVPDEAQDAVRAAANIWEAHLLIDVPITIEVEWEDLDDDRFAQASTPFACSSSRCDPTSLVNQLFGRDAYPDQADMTITLDSDVAWHYGLDANPPEDRSDLVSTVLHEIGHGLGFTDGFSVVETISEFERALLGGSGGSTQARYYESEQGAKYHFSWFFWTWDKGWLYDAEDIENPSTDLYDAITGIKLFWGGRDWTSIRGEPLRSIRANGGPIMMWAPSEFSPGASLSHLDRDAFPLNLMGPGWPDGIAIHDPGPVVLGMLYDMGWELKERGIDPLDVLRCLEGR